MYKALEGRVFLKTCYKHYIDAPTQRFAIQSPFPVISCAGTLHQPMTQDYHIPIEPTTSLFHLSASMRGDNLSKPSTIPVVSRRLLSCYRQVVTHLQCVEAKMSLHSCELRFCAGSRNPLLHAPAALLHGGGSGYLASTPFLSSYAST